MPNAPDSFRVLSVADRYLARNKIGLYRAPNDGAACLEQNVAAHTARVLNAMVVATGEVTVADGNTVVVTMSVLVTTIVLTNGFGLIGDLFGGVFATIEKHCG